MRGSAILISDRQVRQVKIQIYEINLLHSNLLILLTDCAIIINSKIQKQSHCVSVKNLFFINKRVNVFDGFNFVCNGNSTETLRQVLSCKYVQWNICVWINQFSFKFFNYFIAIWNICLHIVFTNAESKQNRLLLKSKIPWFPQRFSHIFSHLLQTKNQECEKYQSFWK